MQSKTQQISLAIAGQISTEVTRLSGCNKHKVFIACPTLKAGVTFSIYTVIDGPFVVLAEALASETSMADLQRMVDASLEKLGVDK